MEKTQKKPIEFKSNEDKKLSEVWKNSIVLNLRTAKKLLKAFKQENLKQNSDCLIFEDTSFIRYRRLGEQKSFQLVGVFEDRENKTLSIFSYSKNYKGVKKQNDTIQNAGR